MKQCKDCKWFPRRYSKLLGVCPTWTAFRDNSAPSCSVYSFNWSRLWSYVVFVVIFAVLIALALLLGGCTTWNVDKTAYRLDGSIESRTKASMNQWLTDSTRTKVAVEINDVGKAEIGSSVLDAESIADIIKALPEGLRKEILALLGIGL